MDRLTEAIKEKIELNYKSVREFSQAVDVPYTTILTALSKGFGGTAVEKVIKICSALNISLTEYSSDLDSSHKNSEFSFTLKEVEHIKKYRALDEYGKEMVDMVLKKELQRAEKQKEVAYAASQNSVDLVREVPLYYMPASAGNGNYIDESDYDMIPIRSLTMAAQADFAVHITGNSMEPKFQDGDIIVVKEQTEVEIGELGIFILNGDCLFKKFGGDRLISLNADYQDKMIQEEDSFYCRGKVLGAIRNAE